MVTVEKYDNFDRIGDIEQAWAGLLTGSETDMIFLTPGWLRVWWRVFGGDKEPYILVVRSGDEVIGIAPLMRTTSTHFGRARRAIEFIGTPNIDYADIVAVDKRLVLRHILDYLSNRPEEWTRIDLAQIPERSCTLEALREIRGGGHPMRIREIETCYGLVYDGPESERSRFAFRKSKALRNAFNVLNKSGGLFIEKVRDTETCRRYLPLLFHLHINRWSGTPTPSKFLNEKHRRFHYELLDALMPLNNIHFAYIRHGIAPLAFALCFEYKGTVSYYTLALNQYYWKRSPGQIMFALLGETCLRQGYNMDYSRGAQEYKSVFANRSSLNYQVTIFNRASEYRRARAVDRLKATRPVAGLLRREGVQTAKIKVERALREGGARGLLSEIIRKAGDIFRRYVVDYREFLTFRFNGVPDLSIKPGIPIKIRRLTAADTERISTFYGAPEDSPRHRTICERFAKKADCIAGIHDGNIVGICWGLYYPDRHSMPGLTLVPGVDEVVICDALVSPIYRGMRVVPYLLARQLDDYRRRGLTVLAGIARADKSSLRDFLNFDFKHTRTSRLLRVFGIRII